MGILRLTAIILLVIVLISPGLNASGFENTGVGLRARGMGGAFRALANDWTAAYYNPAGYAFIYDNQLGASVGFLNNRQELTPNYKLGGEYETGMYNGQTLYNIYEIYNNPSGGFLLRLPVWGETVFGLSAFQRFDYNLSWRLYDVPRPYNDSTRTPGIQYKNNFDVVTFQLTAAREFMEDKLAIGIGLQVLRADLLFSDLTLRDNPLDTAHFFEGADPNVDTLTYPNVLSNRPYDVIPEFSTNDGYGWGFGINGGLLYKVNEDMNVALSFNIPFKITIDGATNLQFILPRNIYVINNDDPSITYFQPGKPGYLFANGDSYSINADFETELKLPPSVGIGIAYDVNEKLTVALDAEMTFWSQFEGFDFKYSSFDEIPLDTIDVVHNFFTYDLSNPTEWNDAGKIMAGAQYKLNENITLLGGISADQTPLRDGIGFIPQWIDTGDKYGFNGGFLFNVDRWEFGVVGSYYHYPDLTVGSLQDVNHDGKDDYFPGEYKPQQYEVVLAFNYWF